MPSIQLDVEGVKKQALDNAAKIFAGNKTKLLQQHQKELAKSIDNLAIALQKLEKKIDKISSELGDELDLENEPRWQAEVELNDVYKNLVTDLNNYAKTGQIGTLQKDLDKHFKEAKQPGRQLHTHKNEFLNLINDLMKAVDRLISLILPHNKPSSNFIETESSRKVTQVQKHAKRFFESYRGVLDEVPKDDKQPTPGNK